MNNNDVYIVYSATGSFVGPLVLIIFLNWGIFVHGRRAGNIQLRGAAGADSHGLLSDTWVSAHARILQTPQGRRQMRT
jgi:hypothetical protein